VKSLACGMNHHSFRVTSDVGVRVGAMHLQKCTRVCVSPRERRNDAGLLSLQNRFTWPASDKSSPGTVGYPLLIPFTPPRLPAFVYLPYVCQAIEAGLCKTTSRGLLSWPSLKFQNTTIPSEFYGFVDHVILLNYTSYVIIYAWHTINRSNNNS